MLTSPIPLILFDDPVQGYAELAATVPAGGRYRQNFDFTTIENPEASVAFYLEDLYPSATVLGTDLDIGSWEINQGALGACGTFAKIAAYGSVKSTLPYTLENSIYPTRVSPIGLYLVRIQDPTNLLQTKWLAIDSRMPCKPVGKSHFGYPGKESAIAPLLFLKAAATARGGCFDEITNHAQLKLQMGWFPNIILKASTFADYKALLDIGGLSLFSMPQQYDASGAKITPSGVVYGHAFAGVEAIEVPVPDAPPYQLVRVSNPWGGGSDYISEFSDTAPFWDAHPELAEYVAASRQAGGEYWVTWDCLKAIAGRSTFEVEVPLPHPQYSYTTFYAYAVNDIYTTVRKVPQMQAIAKARNEYLRLFLPKAAKINFCLSWAGQLAGDRHSAIVLVNSAGAILQSESVYWGGKGTVSMFLPAGDYEFYPRTWKMDVDRGILQILAFSDQEFVLAQGNY